MAYSKKTEQQDEGLLRLKADLKQDALQRCYVFFGEEAFLRTHYLEQLKKKVLDGPAESFNFHRIESGAFSIEELTQAVEALPMMAERTLVQVDDCDMSKLSEAAREKLVDLLQDLPDYCVLVFVYDTVEWKVDGRQKKLAAAIRANVQLVEFRKQGQRELMAWVRRHFRAQQKDIADDLCQYLIFRTGGDMTTLRMEIQKVASFEPGLMITKQTIDTMVEPVLDAVVFDITDAIAARDYDKALSILRVLLRMQEEPIPILAAIGTQLRRMFYARVLMEHGKGADSLMNLCGMRDYPARKTMSAAGKCSSAWCAHAVQLAAQTDYRMKTSYADQTRLLEMLLLQLSQEVRDG